LVLLVSNSSGCDYRIDTATIGLYPSLSAPTVSYSSSLCEGDDLNLSTAAAAAYNWTGPSGFASSSQAPSIVSVTSANTGLYTLSIVDSNGCVSPDTSVNVFVNPLPTAPLATGPTTLCTGDTLNLSISVNSCDSAVWINPVGSLVTGGNLIIDPNSSNYLDGNWQFLCIDTLTGCLDSSNIVTVSSPNPSVISSADTAICIGATTVLTATALAPTAPVVVDSIIWSPSVGLNTSVGNSVNASPASTTVYTVEIYYSDGCNTSDSTIITVNPLPQTPDVPADTTLCDGEQLILSTTSVASIYNWTGPNGYSSLLQNPTAIVVNLSDTGTYTLSVVDSNGCLSSDSSFYVNVNPLPGPVFVTNNGPACPGDTLTLTASFSAAVSYEWFQVSTGSSVGFGQNLDLINVSLADTGLYYVQATLNGCTAVSADSTSVVLYNTTAFSAVAGSDQTICVDSTNMSASAVVLPTFGTWTNASGALINDVNNPNTLVSNLSIGANVFYWTLSTATCSDVAVDSVTVFVNTFNPDTALAGNDLFICDDSVATLGGNAAVTAVGTWVQTTAQASLGALIDNPSDPSTTVSGLILGNTYRFVWQLDNSPCGPVSTDTVLVTVNAAPLDIAAAGTDIDACGIDTVSLAAVAAPVGSTGLWSTPSSAIIQNATSPTAQVYNITQNPSMFIWSLSSSTCIDYSADTLYISLNGASPTANADNVTVTAGTSNTIEVLSNDVLTPNWLIYISSTTSYGQLVNLNNGQFEVVLQPSDTFDQSFIYELCDVDCPTSCDTAIVNLDVSTASCKAPNIFTPNGDGVNDYFEVPCLNYGTAAQLMVFNRWGDEVYSSDNYVNQWDGTHKGRILPDATYFFILTFSDGQTVQSSIELRR
jgi:gliding motility-associated-like protein